METLIVDRAGNGVVTLTLNRPAKKNAMNMAMFTSCSRSSGR
jgi:enoyl-CoA hydratase/carnithine racemase